jgi:hypothetical protein
MSNEKALTIIPRTVEEVRTLAKMFAASALLPQELRGKEADVFVSIMAGQELGLPPMAALRGVHVVKGKPVLAADTMVGIVLGSGLAEYFQCIDDSPESVTYETKRRGAPAPQVCTWTMEDARAAGLTGENWKKYPRAMLKARCKAMLARDAYPDVLAGCYEPDEAREFVDRGPPPAPVPPPRDREVVEDAEVITPAPTVLDDIDAAGSIEQLESLLPRLMKLDDATKAKARSRYGTKKAQLRQSIPTVGGEVAS